MTDRAHPPTPPARRPAATPAAPGAEAGGVSPKPVAREQDAAEQGATTDGLPVQQAPATGAASKVPPTPKTAPALTGPKTAAPGQSSTALPANKTSTPSTAAASKGTTPKPQSVASTSVQPPTLEDKSSRNSVNPVPTGHKTSDQMAGTLSKSPEAGRAPPSGVNLKVSRIFGDYELLEEIARGGMGVVFKARQNSPQRVVALKMILTGNLASVAQIRRFRFEAEEAGRLDHPNIVPIYQVGEYSGQQFFSMKFIEGGNLAQAIKHFQKKPKKSARLISVIARAVHHAHQRGILHRDVKPGNILLDKDGDPHITDFGLAKHLGTEGANTQSGTIVGTPAYMAPEQASGSKDLSVAADVYGLGAVLYELLAGRPPFLAESPMETIMAVLKDDPLPPRSVYPRADSELEIISLKCLAKDPSHRYPSAEALAKDLDRYCNGEPVHARPAGRAERVWKWAKRRPALATLLVMTCLIASILVIAGWVVNGKLQVALDDANRANKEAQLSAEEANRQRVEADRQRDVANRRRDEAAASFDKRLETVDDLVLKIDGRLTRVNGMESVRLEFLHELLNLSLSLLVEKSDNPVVQRQTAKVLFSLGNLNADMGRLVDSTDAYKKALNLMTRLAAATRTYEDRSQLALLHSRRADGLNKGRQFAEARKTYQQALDLEDRLAADFPDKAGAARVRANHALFQIGNVLEELRQTTEAEQTYRQALQRQEQLVGDYPKDSSVQATLAEIAEGLSSLLEQSKSAESRRFLEQAHQAWLQACFLAPQSPQYPLKLQDSFTDLADHYKKLGLHAEILRLGLELSANSYSGNEATDTYNGACFAATALLLVRQQQQLKPDDRARLEAAYGGEAIKLLSKALQCGFKDRDLIDRDHDLDPLRQQVDFRVLLSELDQRLPSKPQTPAEQFIRMVSDFDTEQKQYEHAIARAGTVAERRKVEAKKPPLETLVRQILELAQKHVEAETTVSALGWVVDKTGPDKTGRQDPATEKLRTEALRVIERDHAAKPEMERICRLLAAAPSPGGDRLLNTLAEKHPKNDVRGLAQYARARSLEFQWSLTRQLNPSAAEDLSKQTEAQYELVNKQFGEVAFGRSTLGSTARAELHRFRFLTIGRQAQEIDGEDVAGQRFKLSEHRGKVVVLSFWAHWCGYCRQLYPHERGLVQRLKGQPFELIGINCDEDRAEVKRVQQRNNMTWRSWWSGAGKNGPIMNEWLIQSFPTIYVLDHKGVIRYEGLRGQQLDAAVDRLLLEMQSEKSGSGISER